MSILAGIDIGGTNIKWAVYDKDKGSAYTDYVKYPKGATNDELAKYLYEGLSAFLRKHNYFPSDIKSMGIAVPGSIDIINGVIIDAYNLELHDAPLADAVKKYAGDLPIRLLNDADAATLAEFKLGVLKNTKTSVLITLGTGVGAGIILNGKLFFGGRMNGTEFGHAILDKDSDIVCSCGNHGCVEALCSATYLSRRGSEAFGKRCSAKRVADLAAMGDETAVMLWSEYIENLGCALASLSVIIDPEVIAIGGGISNAGKRLTVPLEAVVAEKNYFRTSPEIKTAMFASEAGAYGACFINDEFAD